MMEIRFLPKALSITNHARSTQILGQFIYPLHLKLRITLTKFQISVKAVNSLTTTLTSVTKAVGGGWWRIKAFSNSWLQAPCQGHHSGKAEVNGQEILTTFARQT